MIINYLSDSDLDMIDLYRKTYVDSSDASHISTNYMNIKYILREWATQKEDLFNLFDQKFILTREIEYHKSLSELEGQMDDLLYGRSYGRKNRSSETFLNSYRDWASENFPFFPYCGSRNLSEEEIESAKNKDVIRCNLLNLISAEVLSTNIWNGDTFSIPQPNGKDLKIANGCKVSRILGKIADVFHLDGYEDFRICHSQILNQKSLTGHLCLSIHPMDYMTMSDNECGWESCMNWREEGGYRQGTVEMMNSPTVIVAYLTSDEDMNVPGGYKWNSKKWRKLFVVSEKCLVGVKDYPYCNTDLSVIVLDWLKELMRKNSYTYCPNLIEYDPDEGITSECQPELGSFNFNFPTYSMYSDFGSAKYHPMYLSDSLNESDFKNNGYYSYRHEKGIEIPYSGVSECMICGDIDCDFDSESDLACNNCQERQYCACCGESIYGDDYVEVDGEIFCSYCADNNVSYCSVTRENHFSENMELLYVIPKFSIEDIHREQLEDDLDDINKEHFCYNDDYHFDYYNDCTDEEIEKALLVKGGKVYHFKDGWMRYNCVYLEDLTPEMKREAWWINGQNMTNEEYIKDILKNGGDVLPISEEKNLF